MRISPLHIGLLLTGLVVLGGLFYAFLFHTTPEVTTPLESTHSTVEVTPIHSDVSVQKNSAPFSVIAGQQKVESGSTIKTSDSGRALIESSSSHITRLDYSSQITITEEEKHTQVRLAGGAVWSRLANLFDSGETYDVHTPNAIASVRGTSFGVWYHENTTIVIVLEGTVLFTPVGDEKNAILVHAGYKATRVGSGSVKLELITKADRLLPWVVFNESASPTSPTTSAVPASTSSPQTTIVVPQAQPVSVGDLVRLSSMSPTTIVEGSQEVLTISGRNLDQVETLTIGGTQVYFSHVNTTTITANAPLLSPGRYSISITAPGGRVSTLTSILMVSARAASPNTVTGKP